MPATANSISTGTSPWYNLRSRRYDHAYTSDSAVTTHTVILSTSAMPSRRNMPLSTAPCPPTPAPIIAATTSSTPIDSTWVTMRRRSSRNRSSISNANAAPTSTSSGSNGSRSAAVGMVGVMASLQLGRGELARQLRDGWFHQVGQWLRPDADQQHACGEYAQHDPFARIHVLHFGDMRIGHIAPDHALGQPQGVGRAGDQGGRRGERQQRVLLEAGQDHHELADETAGARQAGVGHREEDHERGEPRHDVGHAAVVADHAGVHAVVEHADAGEHRAGNEAVADHLHHRALQAEARGIDVAGVAYQADCDEDAQGDEA